MQNKTLKIKLVRSKIGRKPCHLATLRGLGLRKMNSEVILLDNPCTRGMIKKINYLLKVEEL